MREQLAYVLVTPYSILKSRTGGILGRLLSVSGLELVAARMLFPSAAFVEALVETLPASSLDPKRLELFSRYCRTHLGPDNAVGLPNRLLLLLFRGPDAFAMLRRLVGPVAGQVHGDTLRDVYGDYLEYASGEEAFFEPAVLLPPDAETLRRHLEVLAEYADAVGGIYHGDLPDLKPDEGETTLVLIKPDSFRKASSRPGQIIDMFSRSGCFLVAMDLLRLSMEQAEEFYAPLRKNLPEQARPHIESLLRAVLPEKLGFRPSLDSIRAAAGLFKEDQGRFEFAEIIKFMTGQDPGLVTDPEERKQPGRTRCLALLYRGHGAVAKVRAILGPGDPRQAAVGTVRSEFGSDLMRNGAHASANVQDAERERKIIGIYPDGPSNVVPLIRAYLVRRTPDTGLRPKAGRLETKG